ncbi:hypothetical protein QFZ76_000364 [Streptomyces sp. V4I2]|nr:hypothetical protein [Streptomyces sp. V4I2]
MGAFFAGLAGNLGPVRLAARRPALPTDSCSAAIRSISCPGRPAGSGCASLIGLMETEALLAALAELREDLDTGAWVPDECERVMAVATGTGGEASADAVRAGLRAAWPRRDGRLAPVAARCGYMLGRPEPH